MPNVRTRQRKTHGVWRASLPERCVIVLQIWNGLIVEEVAGELTQQRCYTLAAGPMLQIPVWNIHHEGPCTRNPHISMHCSCLSQESRKMKSPSHVFQEASGSSCGLQPHQELCDLRILIPDLLQPRAASGSLYSASFPELTLSLISSLSACISYLASSPTSHSFESKSSWWGERLPERPKSCGLMVPCSRSQSL